MTVAAHLDGVITFPDGLPGFETSRRFVLVASTSLAPFTIVQGTDGRAPSFVAIEPRLVEPGYSEPLASLDLSRLGADPGDALLWLALVAAPPDGGAATVNLRAPLVVNPKSMLGIQLVAAESAYRTDHPLQPV